MTNDNFERYKDFILKIMMEYRELFPIADRIYNGINICDGTIDPEEIEEKRMRLLRYELEQYIGLDKYIADIVESPLWVSYFLVAPKDDKVFYKHIHVLEKAMYNTVLSYYVERFLSHDQHKIVDKMMNEL